MFLLKSLLIGIAICAINGGVQYRRCMCHVRCQLRDLVNCVRWQFKTKPASQVVPQYDCRSLCLMLYGSCWRVHSFASLPTRLAIKCDIKLRIAFICAYFCGWECKTMWKQDGKTWYLCYQLDEHKYFIDHTMAHSRDFFSIGSPHPSFLAVSAFLSLRMKNIVYPSKFFFRAGPLRVRQHINYAMLRPVSSDSIFA